MKALVIYYSRTGNTRKVAEAIASALRARAEVDVEELKDLEKRKLGFIGFMAAGRDALLKRNTPIEPVQADTEAYDVVIVGTPVWAWGMTSAVRTFLDERAKGFKRTAFFLTTGGTGREKTFKQMAASCGQLPIATLGFTEKELKDAGGVDTGVKEFVEKVTGAGSSS